MEPVVIVSISHPSCISRRSALQRSRFWPFGSVRRPNNLIAFSIGLRFTQDRSHFLEHRVFFESLVERRYKALQIPGDFPSINEQIQTCRVVSKYVAEAGMRRIINPKICALLLVGTNTTHICCYASMLFAC
jgi:hypothetical protein